MPVVMMPPPRPAGPADAELLAGLHTRCFGTEGVERWDRPAFATLLGTPGIGAFLAIEVDAAPVGFIVVRVGGGESEILTVGILPGHRRRGHGLALIETAARQAEMNGAEVLFLEVADDNHSAQALYRSGGFQPVGRRAGYYRRRSARLDAIVLRRILRSPGVGPSSAETGPL